MSISKIPPEILTSIAIHVPDESLPQCSLVCKQWREVFFKKLWEKVEAHDKKSTAAVFDISSENRYLIYGQYVKTIYIYGDYHVSSKDVLFLQQLFPNISYVWLTLLCTEMTDTDTDWSTWKALKTFVMDFRHCIDSILIKLCPAILSQLPNVTDLVLFFEDSYISKIGDFEAIHDYMPSLRVFTHNTDQARLTDEDMERIAKTAPANSLLSFTLRVKIQDLRWLYYFALKYPNVREMDLQFYGQKDYLKDSDLAVASSKISMLSHVFPSLEKIAFFTRQFNPLFRFAFRKIFHQKTVFIKEFKYEFFGVTPDDRIFETMKEVMSICSETIEYIQFAKTGNYMEDFTPHDISKSFIYCPRLTTLSLQDCNASIQVDMIADYCPSLKELYLFSGRIYIGPETVKSARPHGLRILMLYSVYTDPDTLKYISVRCESLSHMILDRLRVFGSISADTGNLLIDMSSARLTELRFSRLRFIAPGEIGPPYRQNEIDLIKLVRLIAPYPRTVEGREQIEESSTDHVPICKTAAHWFASGLKYMQNTSSILILKQAEIDRLQEYFDNYQENMLSGKMETIQISKESETPQTWDMDPSRGYVTFMCGYAEGFAINEVHEDGYFRTFSWNRVKNTVEKVFWR
ncbi:hypothetical protein J3Q64DRAFT_1745029 [Phycomyces blakesleeanus]|uniref:F-box domain-containing protein n=2 Tax=Phycomyces blakesleeanus TaxID=4837 RepID=A0A162U7S2_PHYB8|nr:hypothetical protein PHYBLDRAFT_167547 [Phycomyces blakesleeanus NRRL 1555(-)]OAD74122.1 hypothetical protein PHYBLDRAFT_167547 [Phycomyces blakesleeanus NRRL 1555(-)]|eukprot:XP_018292162.1 hypothetical protein PHYBLDRAFT_167547 [Phycomyces blakesleeanus NRRL 1555(-)]